MKTTTTLFIRFLSLIWFMAVLGFAHAQSVRQQIVATDGGYTETETISMSWTIGDISISTMTNASLISTQGFQ